MTRSDAGGARCSSSGNTLAVHATGSPSRRHTRSRPRPGGDRRSTGAPSPRHPTTVAPDRRSDPTRNRIDRHAMSPTNAQFQQAQVPSKQTIAPGHPTHGNLHPYQEQLSEQPLRPSWHFATPPQAKPAGLGNSPMSSSNGLNSEAFGSLIQNSDATSRQELRSTLACRGQARTR